MATYLTIDEITAGHYGSGPSLIYCTRAARRNGRRIFSGANSDIRRMLLVNDSRWDRHAGSGVWGGSLFATLAAAQCGYATETPWCIPGNFHTPISASSFSAPLKSDDLEYTVDMLPPKWANLGASSGIGVCRFTNGSALQGDIFSVQPNGDVNSVLCCSQVKELFPRSVPTDFDWILLSSPTTPATDYETSATAHNSTGPETATNSFGTVSAPIAMNAAIGTAFRVSRTNLSFGASRNITCRMRSTTVGAHVVVAARRAKSTAAPHGFVVNQWGKGGQPIVTNVLSSNNATYIADKMDRHHICLFLADVNNVAVPNTAEQFEEQLRLAMAMLRSQFGDMFFVLVHSCDAYMSTAPYRTEWDRYAGAMAAVCDGDPMCALCVTRAETDRRGLTADLQTCLGKTDLGAWASGTNYTALGAGYNTHYVQSGTVYESSVNASVKQFGHNWLIKQPHTSAAGDEPQNRLAGCCRNYTWQWFFNHITTATIPDDGVHLSELGQMLTTQITWDAIMGAFMASGGSTLRPATVG